MGAVTKVRYPELRQEVILNLAHLADAEYQQRVWMRREYPREDYFDDLTLTINVLYDLQVLPDPGELTAGIIIWSDEVAPLEALARILDPLIRALGNRPDSDYMDDPLWPSVMLTAKHAADAMISNEQHSLREGGAE